MAKKQNKEGTIMLFHKGDIIQATRETVTEDYLIAKVLYKVNNNY
jgi:hypothetical protein